MQEADSVLSTPPINTSQSRRAVLAGIGSAAVIPTTAALAATPTVDPIFAAIDAFRQADAAFVAWKGEGDIPDELGDRQSDAFDLVLRTRPTTLAGLVALTTLAREQADWLHKNGSAMSSKNYCILSGAIEDAAIALNERQS
jgi:hypothetical protein